MHDDSDVSVADANYYGHVGIVAIGLNQSISSLSASVLISQVREQGSISSPVSGQ